MSRTKSWLSAHPRSRGEHLAFAIALVYKSGSSPLARGTHDEGFEGETLNRLIPARAGNTLRLRSSSAPFSAHPRSRGEHSYPDNATGDVSGSSPLARGTRWNVRGNYKPFRLIPARAGNTAYSTYEVFRY